MQITSPPMALNVTCECAIEWCAEESGRGHRCTPASRLATTPACGSCCLPTLLPPASELPPPACEVAASRLGLRTKLPPEAGASAAGKTELPPASRLEPEPGCRSCRLVQAAAWGGQLDLPPGWCLASKDAKLPLLWQPSVRIWQACAGQDPQGTQKKTQIMP